MAVTFRFAYNGGINYIDSFPKTNVQGIADNENLLTYSSLNVTIPVPTQVETRQIISVTTTEAQVAAPFVVYLMTQGEQARYDYDSISQIQVEENQVIITRLHYQPQQEIQILIVFSEGGVNNA